jgi:ceramide glucosyltransferase
LRFVRDSRELPIRVSVGEDESLENPKVALLERMSWHSDGDWVVVSDSNVRVPPDYVRDALSHAAPDVGLIHIWWRVAAGARLSPSRKTSS